MISENLRSLYGSTLCVIYHRRSTAPLFLCVFLWSVWFGPLHLNWQDETNPIKSYHGGVSIEYISVYLA